MSYEFRSVEAFSAAPVSLGNVTSAGYRGVYAAYVKRVLDLVLLVVVALPVLVILSTLTVIIARDGGAPFYVQERVGRHGRIFRMWKLRSMVVDADARLASHLAASPEAKLEWDKYQKLRNDPRITRFGRFIRATSLDELPQLWNVLKGEMSIVGPRPMLPEQQDMYPDTAYYELRPGLTGLWQVSQRNQSSFVQRAAYDRTYAEALSLQADLAIILRTASVVLRKTGV